MAPHLALLPSAGMGHLAPFLRLAAALSSRGCRVTLITPSPPVSAAESAHLSSFLLSSPLLHSLDFPLLPLAKQKQDKEEDKEEDPFFVHFERIRLSAHCLPAVLDALSPPPAALIVDVTLTSAVLPTATLPAFVLFTSSAAMLSLCLSFPGLPPDLPPRALPQPLRHPPNLFATQFALNSAALRAAAGLLVNTWPALEPPPARPGLIPLGPLAPPQPPSPDPWLASHPPRSVLYLSFGSRTALPPAQTLELAAGLELSQCRFLWVLKTKKVDREEAGELETEEELLGVGFLKRVEGRGKVVKGWVDQGAVLAHPSVGGFVSHCGWNSVTEAAVCGVPVLAWPRHGDQRINAMVVERSGLGEWPGHWSWDGEGELVGREEIGRRIAAFMACPDRARAAALVRESALAAAAPGGSSDLHLDKFIKGFSKSD